MRQSKGCVILVAIRWFPDMKMTECFYFQSVKIYKSLNNNNNGNDNDDDNNNNDNRIIIENDDIINIIISSFSCDNLYLAKLTGKNKNLEAENIFVVIFDTC